jgi:protein-S-isoprenylcysteine O-methyltransferase Ste14
MRPPIFFGVPGATWLTVIAFWAGLYAWLFSEIWLGWKKRALPSGAKAHDRGSRWLLISSIWLSAFFGIGFAMALPQTAIEVGRSVLFGVGLVLLFAGMVLRWYAIVSLGSSFTLEVSMRAGQRVMQTGPYRWIRHPSYTGSLLTILGILLCCLNWASLVLFVLPVVGYAYRIRVEEEALVDGLGDEYRTYMRHTRRLIPLIF